MASVLIVVKSTKQPRGGFISPSSLVKTPLSDGQVLAAAENIPATTIGMVVDYMTRFMAGTKLEEAFKVSLAGAMYAQQYGPQDSLEMPSGAFNRTYGDSSLTRTSNPNLSLVLSI